MVLIFELELQLFHQLHEDISAENSVFERVMGRVWSSWLHSQDPNYRVEVSCS